MTTAEQLRLKPGDEAFLLEPAPPRRDDAHLYPEDIKTTLAVVEIMATDVNEDGIKGGTRIRRIWPWNDKQSVIVWSGYDNFVTEGSPGLRQTLEEAKLRIQVVENFAGSVSYEVIRDDKIDRAGNL